MADDPDPRVGSVVDGRYRILERLAQGGMGVVYRGERVPVGRPVALKFLHAFFADDRDSRTRFERETRALCKLAHPHCVSIIDFGVDGSPYLVMDHVTGPTLRELLDEGPLPIEDALMLGRQLLAGLAHAHNEGIVHRDIKPANLMVSEQVGTGRHLRILDFGLARLRDHAGANITQSSIAVGTPSYMAPEQTVGGETDARSDVYAAGVVLFEMLTGEKPFTGEDSAQIMARHRSAPVPKLADVLDRPWPQGLDKVLARAMAKKPDDRWQTAEAFAEALDRVARGEVRATTTTVIVRSRWGLAIAAIALMLATGAAVVAYLELRSQPKPDAGPPPPSAPAAPAAGSALAGAVPVLAPDAAAVPVDEVAPDAAAETALAVAVPVDAAIDTAVDAAEDAAPDAGEDDAAAAVVPPADESDIVLEVDPDPPADPDVEPSQAVPDDEVGSALPVAPPPPEPPPTAAPPPRTVRGAMALVKQGRRDEAISALRVLWKQQPKNANLPFVLGNLYHDKKWWSVAIQHYQAAISRDKAYKRNATLIHNLIDTLASSKTSGRAGYVLKKVIGAPARNQLKYAAKHHKNVMVRRRAAALLR